MRAGEARGNVHLLEAQQGEHAHGEIQERRGEDEESEVDAPLGASERQGGAEVTGEHESLLGIGAFFKISRVTIAGESRSAERPREDFPETTMPDGVPPGIVGVPEM